MNQTLKVLPAVETELDPGIINVDSVDQLGIGATKNYSKKPSIDNNSNIENPGN